MIFRKTHPYERRNPERGTEDVVKTFKNHTRATSIFVLCTILAIFLYVFFFSYYFPNTDISLILIVPLVIVAGYSTIAPMKKFLSRLFKDPSAGVFMMSFLIAGPFIISTMLFLNSLYTFTPSIEAIRINSYEAQTTRSRRSSYTNYILQLEENKFKYQIGFRTSSTPPDGTYAVYRYKRGILGLRIIDSWYYSDKNETTY